MFFRVLILGAKLFILFAASAAAQQYDTLLSKVPISFNVCSHPVQFQKSKANSFTVGDSLSIEIVGDGTFTKEQVRYGGGFKMVDSLGRDTVFFRKKYTVLQSEVKGPKGLAFKMYLKSKCGVGIQESKIQNIDLSGSSYIGPIKFRIGDVKEALEQPYYELYCFIVYEKKLNEFSNFHLKIFRQRALKQ